MQVSSLFALLGDLHRRVVKAGERAERPKSRRPANISRPFGTNRNVFQFPANELPGYFSGSYSLWDLRESRGQGRASFLVVPDHWTGWKAVG